MMAPGFVKTLMHENRFLTRIYNFFKGWYMHWHTRGRRQRLRRYGGACFNHLHEVLTKRGITYFANYGTLLGVVRDKRFIRNDDDIDISIAPNTCTPKELFDALKDDPNVRFWHAYKWRGRVTEMSFTICRVGVDVFFQYIEDGVNYSHWYDPVDGKWSAENGGRYAFRRPIPIPVNIHDVEFEGGIVPIPTNADEILTSAYGDWRTPRDKNTYSAYEDVRPPKTLLSDRGWMITDTAEL